MAVTADKLRVKITSSGGKTVARSLKTVGRAAKNAGKDAAVMGREFGDSGRAALALASKAQALKGRLDATADEFNDVSKSATAASGSLGLFATSATAAKTAATGLAIVAGGSLLTSIAAVVASLGPLVAALGAVAAGAAGVAAAFGLVMATGIFAWTEKVSNKHSKLQTQATNAKAALIDEANGIKNMTKAQKKQLRQLNKTISYHKKWSTNIRVLKNSLNDASKALKRNAMQLGKQFIPLMKDAVNALPQFINRVFAAIGPLDTFKRELRRLGGIAMQVIPNMVGAFFDFARKALPVFRQFINFLRSNTTGVLNTLWTAVQKTSDNFMRLTGAVMSLFGPFMRVSTTWFQLLEPALTGMVIAVREVMTWMNKAGKAIGRFGRALFGVQGSMKKLSPRMRAIVRIIRQLASVVRTTATKAFRALQRIGTRVATRLTQFWRRHGTLITTTVVGAYRTLRSFVVSSISRVMKFTRSVVRAISRFWQQHRTTILTTVLGAYRTIERVIRTSLRQVQRGTRKATKSARNLGTRITRLSKQFISLRAATVAILAAGLLKIAPTLFSISRGAYAAIAAFRTLSLVSLTSLVPSLSAVALSLNALLAPLAVVGLAVAAAYAAWKVNLFGIRNIARRVSRLVHALIRGNFGKATAIVQRSATTMRQSLVNAWNRIRQIVGPAVRWLHTNLIRPVVRSIEKLWRQHGQMLMREARQTWTAVKGHIQTITSAILNVIKVTTGIILTAWRIWGQDILALTKFVFDNVGSVINATLDAIVTLVGVTMDIIQGDWTGAWNKIVGFTERLFNGLGNFFEKWGTGLINWGTNRLIPGMVDVFTGLGDAILDAVINAFNGIANWIMNDAANALARAGRNAGQAAADGLRNAFNSALPNQLSIPKIKVGGGKIGGKKIPSASIGGQSLNIPKLDTGGYIQSDGLAMLHAGEQVVKAADVDRDGGGGGTGVTVNIGTVQTENAETFARDLDDAVGKYLG